MAIYDDYSFFRGFWFGKDGSGPYFLDPLGTAVPIGGGASSLAFSALTGDPTDHAGLNTALAAKADLVGGAVPSAQLPPGVGVNRVTVRCVTLANVTIATALNSGDTVDGVTLANDDLVLVANQTNKAENGVYVVSASPARSTSYDAFAEYAGLDVVVSAGTTKAGSTWRFTSGTSGTIGVTALEVTQISLTGAALAANNLSDMNAATVKANLSLDAVNNTADADKPTSTAQQASIDTAVATRVKFGTAAPSGGSDGDIYVRVTKPYYGIIYEKVAGTWAYADNSYTWATRPTAEAAIEGLIITISDLPGKPEYECVTYDGGTTWRWAAKKGSVRYRTYTTTALFAAQATTDVLLADQLVPGGLAFKDCRIKFFARYSFENLTANAKSILFTHVGTGNKIMEQDLAADITEVFVEQTVYCVSDTSQIVSRVSLIVDAGEFDGLGAATTGGSSSSWNLAVDNTFGWYFDSVSGETTLGARLRLREIEITYPS